VLDQMDGFSGHSLTETNCLPVVIKTMGKPASQDHGYGAEIICGVYYDPGTVYESGPTESAEPGIRPGTEVIRVSCVSNCAAETANIRDDPTTKPPFP
jgi:hypothetical protein